MKYAAVILEVSVQKTLDYSIPEALEREVSKGVAVEVPLRGHPVLGWVVEVKEHSPVANPLPIGRVLSRGPALSDELFELALFIAKYYITPLGRVIKTMLPAGVRKNTAAKTQYYVTRAVSREEMRVETEKMRTSAPAAASVLDIMLQVKKGILHSELVEKAGVSAGVVKSLVEKGILATTSVKATAELLEGHEFFRTKPKPLRAEQKEALEKIAPCLEAGRFAVHLLFGITGSGKTEVYLQSIEKALSEKKGVIMLVPEISLTEQTIERARSRFAVPLAILHHRLSDGERAEAWEKIKAGEIPIAIGARSAIFSPMPNLGLIIVDEEHESSYKQSDESPTYNARDIAIMRAKQNNATCILGSATPSLESFYNAQSGKYTLSYLRERGPVMLPQVITVDMKKEFEKGARIFSDLLLSKISERRKRAEQTILFLNRRGFHTLLRCQNCSGTLKCPHCDTSLTYHRKSDTTLCHICGLEEAPPTECPSCKAQGLIKFSGLGTEKVEAALHAIVPEVRTLRIDADATRHKGSLEALLHEFRSGKADVLIGTQMIAKGLHFPEVTLVGVINTDSALGIPDFRAQEGVFQLITQVAGRSGRGTAPGEVIIQTTIPDHSTIRYASNQDFPAFYAEEIETRKSFGFPPFSHIVKLLFVSKDEPFCQALGSTFRSHLIEELPPNCFAHPLVPAGHAKVKDNFRFQFFVRGEAVTPIRGALERTIKKIKLPSKVSLFVDVDPSSTFF